MARGKKKAEGQSVAHVGVSGFSYASWKGAFYPKETKSEEFLTYYSGRLNSVEINSSFYAPPKDATVKGWAERTKKDFLFAFKAPQLVTHTLRLGKGSSDIALRFSATLDALGPRRGPILFQLPPFMKQDLDLLAEFLARTKGVPDRVFEFRHESWLQDSTFDVLEANKVGFCIAETEEMKPVLRVTGGTAYFRLRKNAYEGAEIDAWASRIRDTAKAADATYVYLRHDETGQNALFAQRLFQGLQS